MKSKINQLKAGVFLSYITMGAQTIISLLYTPVMLRLLGKSEYGVYNLVNSIVSYLGLLSFGFSSAYIRFYSVYKSNKDDDKIASLNGMFITIYSVIALISIIAGTIMTMNASSIFAGGLTNSEIKTAKGLMYLMVLNIAISLPLSVFNSIVTSHEQYIFQRIVNLLRTILNPFLALPLLFLGFKSISLVIVTTIITIMTFVVNYSYCVKKLNVKFDFGHFDFRLLREIWVFSFYIFINIVVDQINWSIDKIILGKFRGSSEVAIYSIGSQFNSLYLTFSTAISSVFIPRVNKLVSENSSNELITKLFTKVARIQLIVLSLIVSSFAFFGKYFIKIWAGEEYIYSYKTSYQIALILMIPVTIPLIQNLGIEIQRAKNKHKFRSFLYLMISVINIILSLILCKKWGGIGCALGTAISLIIGNVIIMNWYYSEKIHLDMLYFWKRVMQFIPSLILPSIIGVGIQLIVKIDSIYKLIGFGTLYIMIYIISIWSIGMDDTEKELIRKPIKSLLSR